MPSEVTSDKHDRLPPDQVRIDRLLRWGEDHPTIGGSAPKIDIKNWTLDVGGEVEHPLRLGWLDVMTMPKLRSVSDFHWVEGWSVMRCEWEGVGFQRIIERVKPKVAARFVTFECADGYATSLSLEELKGEGVLLAYRLNGRELEVGTGFPLRLIVPDKYAYKSPMWLTKIRFTANKELGYWEARGYSDTADVWGNDRRAV